MSRVMLIVLLVLFVIFSLKSPQASRRSLFYPYNHCQPSPCYPCLPQVRRCSPCCVHKSVIVDKGIQIHKRGMDIPGNYKEGNWNHEAIIDIIAK